MSSDATLKAAAEAIACANALLIGAGAGMGVDSGLPDFRGPEGFWNAYPPYRKLGLDFYKLADPRWFEDDPELAWGFYGHRLTLYRQTLPHDGFQILRSWAHRMKYGAFAFTSNIDGHFQRAGFDLERICEVHGSIHWLQCLRNCGHGTFSASDQAIDIDEETMRAVPPLPACPGCGGLARPNVLMFGDWHWQDARTAEQSARMEDWLERVPGRRLVVVECGAGNAVPTVRQFCEQVASYYVAYLIRINVREPHVPSGHIGLPLGALHALKAIDGLLEQRQGS
jgi:NAD-dependent SIR2 family protein deacetylase